MVLAEIGYLSEKSKIDTNLQEVESFEEGRAAQIMYNGSYDNENPVIARMHDFIEQQGYTLGGKHHEIYLNDPRRTAPEKLKMILRQPVGAKQEV